MGQLEKYGLYVLCLVIFLILGVTIWGGGDLQPNPRRTPANTSADLNAGGTLNGQGPGSEATTRMLLGANKGSPGNQEAPKPAPSPVVKNDSSTPPKPEQDTPTPAPTPAPETTRPTHKVKSGDSFDSIARKLGSAALTAEIQRLNPRILPTRMQPGQELLLPTKAEIEQVLARNANGTRKEAAIKDAVVSGAPNVTPIAGPALYTVVKGDTLEGIALRQLGSRKRVEEIKELNPNVLPTSMKVGDKIKLPKK
jgi:LysM repeat protein